MDGEAWEATVRGVTKSLTRLSDFTFTFTDLTAVPFRLIKGYLFLWSARLVLFLNLAFSNSLTLHFLVPKPGRVEIPSRSPQPALLSVEACRRAHFPPGLSRPPQEDALYLCERYKSCVRALLVFHVTRGILVSLSSSFLYIFFSARPTNSRTEAFCHSTSLKKKKKRKRNKFQHSIPSPRNSHSLLQFMYPSRNILCIYELIFIFT